MNDFLQSLRGGQKDKRTPKTRKGFDSPQHYNSSSSSHFYSQAGYHKQHAVNKRPSRNSQMNQWGEEQGVFIPAEIIESITSFIDIMAKNQEFLVDSQERKASAEERKANALEDIATSMRFIAIPSDDEEDLHDKGKVEEFVNDKSAPEELFEFTPPEEVELPVYDEAPSDLKNNQIKAASTQKAKSSTKANSATGSKSSAQPKSPTKANSATQPKFSAQPKSSIKAKAYGKAEKEPVKVIKRTKSQKAKAEPSTVKKGILSRDDVMAKIYSMREKGETFEQVAQFFVEIGQPTFSGRGEWHAQTVHRLCSKKK
ncbi:MAG: hypothetical protein U9N77_03530 [Thermodesulfobacteriota bacterium]|nr:hypothetical protein [Thermodesulfobacteriota bacterium]